MESAREMRDGDRKRELKREGETERGREAGGGEEERDREGQTMNSGKRSQDI